MKALITPRSFGKTDPEVFEILKKTGLELVWNDTGSILNKAQMKKMLENCDGIIVGVDPLDADIIETSPKLKAIAKYGVGVDNIDLTAAEKHGIKVSRTTGANSDAVADYTMALMLSVARKVLQIDAGCRNGDWKKITTIDLNHKTIGIFGLGAIGKLVAKRAQGFDMKVLAYDVCWDSQYADQHRIEKAEPEEIFRQADFISLHLPLTPETRDFVGTYEISLMKPTAIFVNTARGEIVNEDALLAALQEGKIYGAGIDAFREEPPANKAWFELENVVIGSHCAASTVGAIENMGRNAAWNLIRDLGL